MALDFVYSTFVRVLSNEFLIFEFQHQILSFHIYSRLLTLSFPSVLQDQLFFLETPQLRKPALSDKSAREGNTYAAFEVVKMSESDWDSVTVLRKKAPKPSDLKDPKVCT